MERLPNGVLEELLSYRDSVLHMSDAVNNGSDHEVNIMDDRSFIDFLDALNFTGFVEIFDYVEWMQMRGQENGLSENMASEVKSAGIDELRKLLTMHIRIERFSEGHMQKLYEEGFFEAFFDRLGELQTE